MSEILSLPINSSHRVYKAGQKFFTGEDIKKIVGDHLGLSYDNVIGKSRKRELCYCRQVMMYLMVNFTKMSLKSIGEMFGGRDHTTAMNANQTIKDLMDTDERIRSEIDDIKEKLLSMDIHITSEMDLAKLATQGFHILNNLRHATKIWNEVGGIEAREARKKWEERADEFLTTISGKEVTHNSETIKIVLSNDTFTITG